MEKPRMTLDEVLTRMRKSGLSIGQKNRGEEEKDG